MIRHIETNSGKNLREKSAKGAKGILIRSIENGSVKYLFRVYSDDGNFGDYELRFEDLPITIDEDALASFYEDETGALYLDETPETLGWKVVETKS